jgi:DNA-binding LacI/PurR family transcriptional regulator
METGNLPFSVNRNDVRPLCDQVAEGLRSAVVAGFYRPGDRMPSYRSLASMLGVSQIVTKEALRRIAADGIVEARPRLGSVVRDRNEKQWRGHVVFVCPDLDVGYFQTLFAETLRTRLNREGYMFTRASVEHRDAAGAYDLSLLDAALARSVDLSVVLYDRPAIFRHLSKRGVPYVAVAGITEPPAGATGLTRFDFNTAVPELVAACRAAGVRKAVQFRLPEPMSNAAPALRAAGIAVTTITLKPDYAKGKLFSVEEEGRQGMAKLAASRRLDRDTLVFFTSDYLARGALMTMEHLGIKAPEDVRVAIFANAGLGPTYFREITRMEMDPVAAGGVVADAALACLRTGKYPAGTVIGPAWRRGETLRETAFDSERPQSNAHRNSPMAIECNRVLSENKDAS